MNKSQLYVEIAKIIEAQPAMLRESDNLTDFKGWDSLAAVSFIALAHGKCGVIVGGDALSRCRTVGDLVALVSVRLDP